MLATTETLVRARVARTDAGSVAVGASVVIDIRDAGITANGTGATVKTVLGRIKGYLVSDRASAFSFLKMHRRQICWAHLMRKFVSFAERPGDAARPIGGQAAGCRPTRESSKLAYRSHGLRGDPAWRRSMTSWWSAAAATR